MIIVILMYHPAGIQSQTENLLVNRKPHPPYTPDLTPLCKTYLLKDKQIFEDHKPEPLSTNEK